MSFKFGILAVLLVGISALAKTSQELYEENSASLLMEATSVRSPLKSSFPNRVILDAAPLMAGGFGVSFERVIKSHVTFGPNLSFFKLSRTDNAEIKHKIATYGIHARYFTKSIAESSPYVLGGIVNADVTTEAKFPGTAAGSASTSSVGPMAGVGYQFAPKSIFGSGQGLLNVGALYSRGYAIEALAQSKAGAPTTVTDLNIKDGYFLEASLGILF